MSSVHRFSRAIYLELREKVHGDGDAATTEARQRFLMLSEAAVERMAGPQHERAADPAKALFYDVLCYFSILDQERVFHTIKSYMAAAQMFIEREAERKAAQPAAKCSATTRKGKACPRSVIEGSSFCPSHQHLASIVS